MGISLENYIIIGIGNYKTQISVSVSVLVKSIKIFKKDPSFL